LIADLKEALEKQEEKINRDERMKSALQFKIEGFRISVSERKETLDALDGIGFPNHEKNGIRQYIDKQGIKTEVILFQVTYQSVEDRNKYIYKRGPY